VFVFYSAGGKVAIIMTDFYKSPPPFLPFCRRTLNTFNLLATDFYHCHDYLLEPEPPVDVVSQAACHSLLLSANIDTAGCGFDLKKRKLSCFYFVLLAPFPALLGSTSAPMSDLDADSPFF